MSFLLVDRTRGVVLELVVFESEPDSLDDEVVLDSEVDEEGELMAFLRRFSAVTGSVSIAA